MLGDAVNLLAKRLNVSLLVNRNVMSAGLNATDTSSNGSESSVRSSSSMVFSRLFMRANIERQCLKEDISPLARRYSLNTCSNLRRCPGSKPDFSTPPTFCSIS